MRRTLTLLFTLMAFRARAQTGFEFRVGPEITFTGPVDYEHSTGGIHPNGMGSLGLIYHPVPYFGLEGLVCTGAPESYLELPPSEGGGVYSARISMARYMAGVEGTYPAGRWFPFAGVLLGSSVARYTGDAYPSDDGKFTWGLHMGTTYYLSSLVGLRLQAAVFVIPNVSNNSAWFGVDGQGDGFPSFAIGIPSSATITQYAAGLAMVVRFSRLH